MQLEYYCSNFIGLLAYGLKYFMSLKPLMFLCSYFSKKNIVQGQKKNFARYQLLSCSEQEWCSFMIAAWENTTTFLSFHLSTSSRISIFCNTVASSTLCPVFTWMRIDDSFFFFFFFFFCVWTWIINLTFLSNSPAGFCYLNRVVVNRPWYFGHLRTFFYFIRTLLVPWLWKRQKMRLKLQSCDQLLSQSIIKEERYFITS